MLASINEPMIVQRPGRTLTAYRTDGPGNGPVIVFESGLGGDHCGWDPVVTDVCAFATAVTYDRAGYGASDSATDGRGLSALADDLVAISQAVSNDRPLVLVGHSLGGRIVLAAAATGRLDPAGIVLIEPAVDGVSTAFPKLGRLYKRMFMVGTLLAPVGAFKLPAVRRALAGPRSSDPERLDALVAELNRRDYWRLLRQEWGAVTQPMGPIDAPAVPTVWMLADQWTDWGPRQARLTGADSLDLLRLIRIEIDRLTAGNPHHSTVVVTNTTHNIPTDRPQTVVAAVQSVLAARRKSHKASQ